MYCINCGAEVPAEANFCPACGARGHVAHSAPDAALPPGPEEEIESSAQHATTPLQPASLDEDRSTPFEARTADLPSSRRPEAINRGIKSVSWAFIIASALSVIHTLTSERPFWFVISARDSIDQKQIASAVVAVLCESIDRDETSTGSGVMLSEDGIVLTNSHVIPQDDQYLQTLDAGCVVILPDPESGSPAEMYFAKPIVVPGISDEYDLAYLQVYASYRDDSARVYGDYPRKFSALYDAEGAYVRVCGVDTDVRLGDPIRIFGYPSASGSYRLTVTDGIVSSRMDGSLIATSAKVDEGNSGGLAVDKRGCIVGVPSAVLKGTYENLGVIIPTPLIREFERTIAEREARQ